MPTYIGMGNWTQKGIENVKASPERAEGIKKKFKDLGGELKEVFICLGKYDFVFLCETPDEETYVRVMLEAQQAGAIRVESLRVYGGEEYKKIFAGL
jgi:uncharacterized protein with GYD domain